LICIIDCGYQSVSGARIRNALKKHGFTGLKVESLGKNDYRVELAETVKPSDMSALLDCDLGRNKPCGSSFMDRVKVRVEEAES
jgi:hypothetical protein